MHFDRHSVLKLRKAATRTHRARNVEIKGESRLGATLSFTPDFQDGPRKVEIRRDGNSIQNGSSYGKA
jgi:hypothetical protein